MKIIYAVIILAAGAFSWSLIEAQLFRVKKLGIRNDKISGSIKVVFISDIHYGRFNNRDRLERIVKRINTLKADLILIGGDYLDFHKNSRFNKMNVDRLLTDLSELSARYGVFTVLGNHDYYLKKDLDYMLDKMRENNMTILRNDSIKLNIEGNNISLHGVDDLKEGTIDIGKLRINPEELNIILTHNPDFYEEYQVDFDLGLSGHTHGGQVNFFGLYAPSTESKYGQKYIKRINRKGKAVIVTTKGIGCISIPIRFCAVPEIVEVNINGEPV